MGRVRVAAVQFEAGQDVGENLDRCLRMIDAAAAEGAELIVLPEFCNHLSWYDSRVSAHELACRPGDAFLGAIAARAERHRAHIKLNVSLAGADGRTTSANLLYAPDGSLAGRSDKLILMGAEGDHLDPGEQAGPVIATPLGRLGLYCCMEGVINEVCRDLALRGAQVLLNSLNSFATDEAGLHIPVRAAENHVFVVAANKIGPLLPAALLPVICDRLGVPPEWLHGAGESQIVAPDGTVLAKAPRTGEAVVVAEIDPQLADDKRRPDGTDRFAARVPARYGPIVSAPVPRTAPPGAADLAVAVVHGAEAVALAGRAARAGAELVVLPEEAVGDPADLAAALAGTTAHAVTTVGGVGLLIAAAGVVGAQPPLRDADGVAVFELPWGRLAIVSGADVIQPESCRLAALAHADVVAVPFTPSEPWETTLGLLERAAENRLNIVAAAPDSGLILALTGDFTLWTPWQGPFTGRISHPLVTVADGPLTLGTVHPAQAVNRSVSKNTDLVDGRPWRAVTALAHVELP